MTLCLITFQLKLSVHSVTRKNGLVLKFLCNVNIQGKSKHMEKIKLKLDRFTN